LESSLYLTVYITHRASWVAWSNCPHGNWWRIIRLHTTSEAAAPPRECCPRRRPSDGICTLNDVILHRNQSTSALACPLFLSSHDIVTLVAIASRSIKRITDHQQYYSPNTHASTYPIPSNRHHADYFTDPFAAEDLAHAFGSIASHTTTPSITATFPFIIASADDMAICSDLAQHLRSPPGQNPVDRRGRACPTPLDRSHPSR
jgi:hypothetical protein